MNSSINNVCNSLHNKPINIHKRGREKKKMCHMRFVYLKWPATSFACFHYTLLMCTYDDDTFS